MGGVVSTLESCYGTADTAAALTPTNAPSEVDEQSAAAPMRAKSPLQQKQAPPVRTTTVSAVVVDDDDDDDDDDAAPTRGKASADAPVDMSAQSTATVVIAKESKKGLSLANATVVPAAVTSKDTAAAGDDDADDDNVASTSDLAAAEASSEIVRAVTPRIVASKAKTALAPKPALAKPAVNQFVDPDAGADFFSDMAPEVKDNRRLDLEDLNAPAAAAASTRLTLGADDGDEADGTWANDEIE
jgi:hypothetical protein